MPVETKVIISSHNYERTPPLEELATLARNMRDAGADIVKIACTATVRCLGIIANVVGVYNIYLHDNRLLRM